MEGRTGQDYQYIMIEHTPVVLFGISVADTAVSEVISAVGCSVAPSAARKHILMLKPKSYFQLDLV